MRSRSVICLVLVGALLVAMGSAMPTSEASDLHAWDQVINGTKRFAVLLRFNNEAVLDNETELVWEQAPSTTTTSWASARSSCANSQVGDRMGWRLPTFQELASLIDPTVTSDLNNPALPPNHPFTGIAGTAYWTHSTHVLNDDFAWHVNFGIKDLSVSIKTASLYVWCVRGGNVATDAY